MVQGKQLRGFASMDAQKQRDIARQGGRSVPNEKRSFSQNHSLAAAAGRTGGQNVPNSKRSFSQNRALAAEAGRKGGERRRIHRRMSAEHQSGHFVQPQQESGHGGHESEHKGGQP